MLVNAHKRLLRQIMSIVFVLKMTLQKMPQRHLPAVHELVEREIVAIAQGAHEHLITAQGDACVG